MIGVAMKQAGWPRPPLVLGYILGRIMENSLHLSIRAYGFAWLLRPICIAIALLIVITIFFASRSRMRATRDPNMPALSDADGGNAGFSVVFSGVTLCVFAYAIAESFQWPEVVRLFPLVFSVPGVLLAVFASFATGGKRARARRP